MFQWERFLNYLQISNKLVCKRMPFSAWLWHQHFIFTVLFYYDVEHIEQNRLRSSPTDLSIKADRNVQLGFYIAYLILGFGGNTLVTAIMSSKRYKSLISRLFVLNLAVSDISFIAFTPPIDIYSHVKVIRENLFHCRLLLPLLTIECLNHHFHGSTSL